MSIVNYSSESPRFDAALRKLDIAGFHRPGGTDKNTDHSYGRVYEALLDIVPDGGPIMEIGVFHGGSVLLWQELFPDSVVVGVDNCDGVDSSVRERLDSRSTLIFDDAYHEGFTNDLVALGCRYGLLVDDGPHTLESQCRFLSLYLPLLKLGGIAVVEDIVATDHFDILERCVPADWERQRIDLRNVKGRIDDIMLIVRRPKND
jgi:hypothetical protein